MHAPFPTPIRDLKELQEALPLKKAAIDIESELLVYRYRSLIKAGFNDAQAIELLRCQLKT